jgi:hypothetical protein
MGGMKRDAIDFYTCVSESSPHVWVHRLFFRQYQTQRTEAAIEQYRDQIDARKAENYGFMAVVPYAHFVARMLRKKYPKGTDIALAPNPKDIVRYALLFFHVMGADRVYLRYGKT